MTVEHFCCISTVTIGRSLCLLLHTRTFVPMHNSCVCVCLGKRYSVDKQLTYRDIYVRTYARIIANTHTHMNAYAIYHRHRILTEKINTLCHHHHCLLYIIFFFGVHMVYKWNDKVDCVDSCQRTTISMVI